MKKRIMSLVLTFAMILSAVSLFTATAFAADGDTSSEITTIANYEDLVAFINSLSTNDYSGMTVNVTNDITVNENWTANNGVRNAATAEPTGENAKKLNTSNVGVFKGTFNGNNKIFTGLYIEGRGFFNRLNGATVRDITFRNCYSNCTEAVPTSGTRPYIGFLSSVIEGGNVSITNVVLDGCKAYEDHHYYGGIAGGISGGTVTIQNCKNLNGSFYLTNDTALLGGIVGESKANVTISSCENTSALNTAVANKGGHKVGGMVSVVTSGSMVIENSVNRADIFASSIAGGIISDNRINSKVIGCLNTGNISTGASEHENNSYAGGIVGQSYNSGATISGCANMGNITANAAVSKSKGHAGRAIGCANRAVTITDFLNTGTIVARHKGAGVIGNYSNKGGTFERIITVGQVTAYNNLADSNGNNSGAACSLIGTWAGTADSVTYATVNDFYYYNFDSKKNQVNTGVFGIWVNLGDNAGNYNAKYTVENNSINFIGGTTNAGSGSNTQGLCFNKYSEFFANNGFISDLTAVYGEKGASKFAAFGIGERWMMTDTVPMPAAAHRLLNKKAETDGDIDYIGFQKKIGNEKLSEVRLVAEVGGLDYQKVGFKLVMVEKLANYTVDGTTGAVTNITMAEPTVNNAVANEVSKDDTNVYTSLNVYSDNGELCDPITAKDGKFLTAITVKGLPTDGTFTFIVRPYVVAIGETAPSYSPAFAVVVSNGVLQYAYAL